MALHVGGATLARSNVNTPHKGGLKQKTEEIQSRKPTCKATTSNPCTKGCIQLLVRASFLYTYKMSRHHPKLRSMRRLLPAVKSQNEYHKMHTLLARVIVSISRMRHKGCLKQCHQGFTLETSTRHIARAPTTPKYFLLIQPTT